MLQAIAEKIIAKSLYYGYINQEQTEEYLYGLNLIGNIVIADVSTIIIGCCFGMIWECIIFWLFYKILRKYCGGYHFNTSLKCYFSSVVLCIGVLGIMKYISIPIYIMDFIITVSTIVLLIFVPVEAANKPLDKKEFTLYRKIAITLVVILIAVYAVARFCEWKIMYNIMPLSVFSVTVFVIVGKINGIYRNRVKACVKAS